MLCGWGQEARLDRSDLGGVSSPGVSPIALSRRGEFRVVCRMIERHIEKDADVLSVRRLDKVLELGERLSASLRRIVCGGRRAGRESRCHQWHDPEIILHRIRAAELER